MIDKLSHFLKRVDWINTAFLIGTPLVAISGVFYLVRHDLIPAATWALFLFMAVATGLAVTAGYHRLFAHKSFEAAWLTRLILLLFGAAAFENSALRWGSDHRRHHKFVDTDLDPYNIRRGFWYAHMGWVMIKYDEKHSYDNVPDLAADPLVRFQDRHYLILGILVGFALPTLVASLWGDPIGGLLLAGFARTVMNHHFTFSINSFAHLIGARPYSDQNSSRDNWFLAFLTYGEGYHNFHHKFPTDYRNGFRFYHWDPTKWLVQALEWIGQTTDLRRIPNERILQARIRMDERRLIRRLDAQDHPAAVAHKEFVTAARLKFDEAYNHFCILKVEYLKMKKEKLDSLNVRMAILREDLIRAQENLKERTAAWADLCRSFGLRPPRLAASISF